MKLKLLFLVCFFTFGFTFSQYQQLTSNAQISVLTFGPGNSLNDSFGHNAYRVKDDNLDIVFNYGVYDFDTPNFYTKFAQGKLNYKLGANYYSDTKNYYIKQNRTIKEQVLNLTQNQKQDVFNFLSKNYEPENQYYLYDFFYDNCATKIRDVLVETLNEGIVFKKPNNFEPKTFRTLIQDNLKWNSWGSLGIDVALGSVIDKEATPEEHMFLPEYIYHFFNEATVNGSEKKLIKNERTIFEKIENKQQSNLITSPFFIFLILAFIVFFITFKDYKNTRISKWLDIVLFAITGIIGIVLLLLWFATDHSATANNYNLLWAFALNVLVIGQMFKKEPKNWLIKYLKFLVIMLCLLALHWIIGVQKFALALTPFLLALFVRYIYLINHFSSIKE